MSRDELSVEKSMMQKIGIGGFRTEPWTYEMREIISSQDLQREAFDYQEYV